MILFFLLLMGNSLGCVGVGSPAKRKVRPSSGHELERDAKGHRIRGGGWIEADTESEFSNIEDDDDSISKVSDDKTSSGSAMRPEDLDEVSEDGQVGGIISGDNDDHAPPSVCTLPIKDCLPPKTNNMYMMNESSSTRTENGVKIPSWALWGSRTQRILNQAAARNPSVEVRLPPKEFVEIYAIYKMAWLESNRQRWTHKKCDAMIAAAARIAGDKKKGSRHFTKHFPLIGFTNSDLGSSREDLDALFFDDCQACETGSCFNFLARSIDTNMNEVIANLANETLSNTDRIFLKKDGTASKGVKTSAAEKMRVNDPDNALRVDVKKDFFETKNDLQKVMQVSLAWAFRHELIPALSKLEVALKQRGLVFQKKADFRQIGEDFRSWELLVSVLKTKCETVLRDLRRLDPPGEKGSLDSLESKTFFKNLNSCAKMEFVTTERGGQQQRNFFGGWFHNSSASSAAGPTSDLAFVGRIAEVLDPVATGLMKISTEIAFLGENSQATIPQKALDKLGNLDLLVTVGSSVANDAAKLVRQYSAEVGPSGRTNEHLFSENNSSDSEEEEEDLLDDEGVGGVITAARREEAEPPEEELSNPTWFSLLEGILSLTSVCSDFTNFCLTSGLKPNEKCFEKTLSERRLGIGIIRQDGVSFDYAEYEY